MFSGSAFGAGKTALSASVADGLVRRGVVVRYLSEDDLLETQSFGRFERLLGPTDPGTHRADSALVDAATALVEQADRSCVLVTDALLPGFFWLFGRYEQARVQAVADELARVLAPLDPLLVYLHGDPATLVERAAVDRGSDWPALMASRVARWNVPHYPGGDARDLAGVLRLWSWLDAETRALLAGWAVPTLVLDALRPLDDLRDDVLADPRLPQRG
jgi:hypothetical protein